MATFSFTWRGDRFASRLRQHVEREVTKVALQGEAEAKVILSTPGTGRQYPRGKNAVHVASSPGQPPAPDTGALRNKITHEVIARRDEIVARVISPQRYSLHLELGTERIAARPFLRPLLGKMKAAANRILGRL